jgi:uncharacterized membrane protein YsdA (DUF1294 family)
MGREHQEAAMKTFFIGYVIVLNLIGFLLMGIDKRRARRRKYRISERTLFVTALIGGSIGVLIGMYVFRHKTRHLSFVLGIPLILVLQLLLITTLLSWNQRRVGSPTSAVEYELELIRELDTDTIQSFVSYENLKNSQTTQGENGTEAAEAVQLFFQNFKYNIHTETIEAQNATVTVNISNLDAQALAQDLRTEILKKSVASYPYADTEPTMDEYYRLLRDTLQANQYETVVTTAYFHLTRDDSGWIILADETLEDELVGGFISWMNDPWLLTPETVLSVYLDAFASFSGSDWKNFLEIDDVFATYNTEYSGQIDDEYLRQVADSFDYEILSCDTTDDLAVASVRITSIDLEHVLTVYKQTLLSYAATSQSIRDDSVTVSNEVSRLLFEALQQNEQTSSTDITISLSNNGTTWNVTFDDSFTNALMGDVEQAIATFNEVSAESETE